jgi:hypothetical protein
MTKPPPLKTIPISELHAHIGLDKPLTKRQIHYWRDVGIRGSKLEMFKLGIKWFTTTEAVERFIAGQKQ